VTAAPHESELPAATRETIWFAHWLRALSVCVVVVTHLGLSFWALNRESSALVHVDPLPDRYLGWATGPITHLMGFNSFAVGFFFLISGFLIPLTMDGKTVRSFVANRVFRIWPVWTANLVLIASVWVMVSAVTGRPIGVPAGTWVANALLMPDLAHVPTLDPPGWTLLVEVKFYAFCALAGATFGLRRAWIIVATAVGLALYAIAVWHRLGGLAVEHQRVWVVTQVLAWDVQHLCMIFAGVCFYNHYRHGWSLPKAVLTVAVCIVSMTTSALFVYDGAAFRGARYAGYLCAVVVFSVLYARRDQIPASPVAERLAAMSYSLYAVHFVLGMVVVHAIVVVTGRPLIAVLGGCVVVAVASYAMYRLVEAPAIAVRKRWNAPTVTSRAG
jgi:peptidoglycan/LPS O-acetylase OafA/YrhL